MAMGTDMDTATQKINKKRYNIREYIELEMYS